MANITIKDSLRLIAQAAKDYTDYVAVTKVNVVSGKGLSTNDLTNTLLANYNAAYTHSQAAHAPSNAQKNSDITKSEIEAKLTGEITTHSHSYAGSSSVGGAATSANKVNSSLIVKLNSGTTEGTDMYTFNGSAAKTINITPGAIGASITSHTHDDIYYTESEMDVKLDGKADSQHGTHVTYGTSTTSLTSGGDGVVGTSGSVARADHTHTLPAYPTSLKNPKSVIVQLNSGTTEGTNKFTYNGSSAKTINITPSGIGAAPSSHTSDTTVHITANERSTWNAKASTDVATTSANGLMSSTDKSKLDGIASGANKYTHPSTHAATMIVEDEDHRFVTDDNIADWNAKSELVLGETSGTAYRGDRGKTAYDHSQSDHNFAASSSRGGAATSANKVNSSLTIKLNSGTTTDTDMFTFNGSATKTIDITPAAIGASASGHNHNDKYYTESEINTKVTTLEGKITTAQSDAQAYAKSYTDTAVAGVLDTAPEALNTLNELAAALGDDPNFATTVMTEIGKKANSSHGNHVPTTQTANNAVFLRNDNTWATVTPDNIGAAPASHLNTTHLTLGTTSSTAFRGDYGNTAYNHSQAAHAPSNAQPNQNAFSNVKIGSTTVAADSTTDTIEFVAGSNITLTPDATNDKITITATDTIYTHPSSHAATMITEDSSHRFVTDAEKSAWNAKASTSAATTSSNGLMTSAMVTKLNGIADNANNYSHPTNSGNKHIPSGGSSGQFLGYSADGTAAWVNNPNTDYRVKTTAAATTKLYLTGCTGATTGELKYDGSVYLDTTAGHLTATQFNGALVGNVTGNVSGSSGSCTGNAATASKAAQLTTARNITIGNQTQSFNGTAAISFDLVSIGVEQISDTEVDDIISSVFGD